MKYNIAGAYRAFGASGRVTINRVTGDNGDSDRFGRSKNAYVLEADVLRARIKTAKFQARINAEAAANMERLLNKQGVAGRYVEQPVQRTERVWVEGTDVVAL